jgi:L-iditol 2-dehydrogenase
MTETMRAAVLVDVDRFELQDVPIVHPAAHEVLLRVQAVGVCGTDMHIAAGHANYNADEHGRLRSLREQPQILGHEIAGVVAEIGGVAHDLAVGARVIVDQGRCCVSEGRDPGCEYCRTGDSHQCEWYREHGITGLAGGFAEFVTMPAVNAVRVRGAIPPEVAALSEPLGCVLHAAELMARSNSRYAIGAPDGAHVRTILICGGGPSGLLFVQYLRRVANFDGRILVSEPSPLRRALAERFGAETIDPTATDLADEVAARSDGRRAELLIEASGAGSIFDAIPALVRKQGTILLYGHGHVGTDLSALNRVQFLEPTFVSPVGASGGHDAEGRPLTYVRALRLLEEGVIDVAPIISHRFHSLDAVPSIFAGAHRDPDFVKGVLTT